ncbi:type II toxin-antitoxin system VapC family toxin [Leucobacter insecticola]|uniref:Ribonuclease VapC n=1 Tax=Leucobacter insecticola TaxID=2714934 RepID=A0A6G8FH33_9MICO|nr:type II toxin-antitoxin system VapC family toxin [Leucobacter insecticola]QIM15678.1 type II toxin-antitoxin system VapC family toxin [Leucobacter insecticola]
MSVEAMADAVLVDAATALYALNPRDPRSLSCRKMLVKISSGKGRGYASTEMIQEVVFHRMRITQDRTRSVQDGRDLISRLTVLKFDDEVLETSLKLIEQLPRVRGRDAVHAATALVYGIPRILSPDSDFDEIPGITRIDPTVG